MKIDPYEKMVSALALGTQENLALSVAIGATTYVAVLVLLGAVPEEIKLHLPEKPAPQG